MGKIRVGVLRGGPSSEYDVSLKSGKAVLANLPHEKYETIDVFISRDGTWHLRGLPKTPNEIFPLVDAFFLALHGEYGEDGQVQKFLDSFSVPYTGSQSFPSAMSMNKAQTKEVLSKHGIKIPKSVILEVSTTLRDDIVDAVKLLGLPLVVKPANSGSSVGVTIAHNEESLAEGVRKAFEYSHLVLLEEYIEGKEATCGVVDNFRGQNHYSLLPIEIIPDEQNSFFDYEAKYKGKSKEICPGNFTSSESEELQELAKLTHEKMGLRHYSRSDFIISDNGIYFLEVNTLPGLTEESLLPKSIKAIGSNLPEFLDHIVTQTLEKN